MSPLAVGLVILGVGLQSPEIRVIVDGEPVEFGPGVSKPRLLNGIAYARVCSISEAVGAKMTAFLTREKTAVLIDRGSTKIDLFFSRSIAIVNGKEEPVPAPALQIGGESFFPIRYVLTRLGMQVYWDEGTHTVFVRIPKEFEPSR